MKNLLLMFCLFVHLTVAFAQSSLCLHSDSINLDTDTVNQNLISSINLSENPWLGKTAPCASNNGYLHTPKGRLHVLMIFVSYNNYAGQYTDQDWVANDMPNWAKGVDNNLFNSDPNQIGIKNNISMWYNVMSAGKFIVTGEVYHVNIDVVMDGTSFDYKEMNKRVLNKLLIDNPGIDLSKFDRRINGSNFNRDNSEDPVTDKILDYVAINYRLAPGGFANGGSSTLEGVFSHNIGSSGYRAHQFGGHYNSGVNSQYHLKRFFHHEFAHNIYDANHNGGANATVGFKYYCNQGWGMMSDETPVLETINAWEKWWMGWINPQTASQSGGAQTFYIKDFITENDALRVPIPGTNQFLWIENHQLSSTLDTKIAYREYQNPTAGIYAFITSSFHDCSNPSNAGYNAGINMIKVLSAQGNKDYKYNPDNNVIVNGISFPSFDVLSDNPISGGSNFTLLRDKYLTTNPNIINYSTNFNGGASKMVNEQERIYAKNGIFGAYFVGEPADVFQVGAEMSLSGILPVLPYPDFYYTFPLGSEFVKYKLEPILLNGLSVKIIALNNGIYEVQVKYDDIEVKNNKRWTGEFDLPNISGNANPDLIISSNVSLTLNKSKIKNVYGKSLSIIAPRLNADPMQNWSTPDFVLPTVFRCRNNSYVKLEQYSSVLIEENSQIILEPTSKFEIQNGAVLHITQNSVLTLDNQSLLVVAYGGKVIVENGGKIVFKNGANIHLSDVNSVIEIKDGGKIEIGSGATFTWSGAGFVKVNVSTIGVSNFVATTPNSNAKIDVTRTANNAGFRSKLFEITSGSMSIDKSLTAFNMNGANIELGQNAILDVDPELYLVDVLVKANASGITHGGIWVYGQQNTPYLNRCVIENATVGFRSFSSKGVATTTMLKYTNFISCQTGVVVYGKSAEIMGCKFYRNKTGILLDGIQTESLIQNVEAKDNRSAIDIVGSGTEIIRIRNCKLVDNQAVGVFTIKAVAAPGCSEVFNNYDRMSNQGGNIFLREQSTLMSDPNLTPYTGKNDLHADKGDAVGFLQANQFYINQSASNFLATNGMSLNGTLRPLGPINIGVPLFDFNYWNSAGTSPVATKYHIEMQLSSPSISLMLVALDNSPLATPPIVGNCIPSSGNGSGSGSGNAGNTSYFIGNGNKIIGDNGESISDLFTIAVDNMYEPNYNFLSALEGFEKIITYNYEHDYDVLGPNNETITDFLVHLEMIQLAYLKAMELYEMAHKQGQVTSELTDKILMINVNYQSSLVMYPEMKNLLFNAKLDEALIYRLNMDYSVCLDKLNELEQISWPDESCYQLIHFYTCRVQHEISMQSETITKSLYPELGECLAVLEIPERLALTDYLYDLPIAPFDKEGSYGKRGAETGMNQQGNKTIEPEITNNVVILPNPSKGVFRVENSNRIKSVEIYDLTGKLVWSNYLNIAEYTTIIDTKLRNGMYLLNVTCEGGDIIKKKILVSQ